MKIGLTGGVAMGKSTVAGIMTDLGLSVVSADQIARTCLDRIEVQDEVAQLLGLPTPLDRRRLLQLVSEREDSRRILNRVLHPLVMFELRQSVADVCEIPLLIEGCLLAEFERIVVVTCEPAAQLRRLVARVGDETLAKKLISTQLANNVKVAFSDTIINTDVSIEELRAEIPKKLREIGVLNLAL